MVSTVALFIWRGVLVEWGGDRLGGEMEEDQVKRIHAESLTQSGTDRCPEVYSTSALSTIKEKRRAKLI